MKLVTVGRSGLVSAVVDDDDYPIVRKFRWYVQSKDKCSYAVSSGMLMHRLILGLKKGDGKYTDHVDGNGLNNTRANLRVCSHAENMRNRRKHNNASSKYKGVYLCTWSLKRNHTKVWRAELRLDGERAFRGWFLTEEEAAKAYDQASEKYHQDFSRTNQQTKKMSPRPKPRA